MEKGFAPHARRGRSSRSRRWRGRPPRCSRRTHGPSADLSTRRTPPTNRDQVNARRGRHQFARQCRATRSSAPLATSAATMGIVRASDAPHDHHQAIPRPHLLRRPLAPQWTARQDCRCSHIAGMCTFRAYVMAGAPVGTTGPGTGVQSTFDRSRLLHEQKSEASIADSVRVRVPPSCAAEFVELLALGGAVLALPGGADLLATRARRTDPRRTAVASASLETNITWLTDTHVASRAAGTASPARRRGAARSPRRESRTPPARAVPAPTANSQPSPSV